MSVDDSFYDDLQGKYGKRAGGDAWKQEHKLLRLIIAEIEHQLAGRYRIVAPLNIGGTAVVLKLEDVRLGVFRALKCPRPLAGREMLLKEILESEISRLIECAHVNVVSVFDRGSVELEGKEWPYYIMEYLLDPRDAVEWLSTRVPSGPEIAQFLVQCLTAVRFMHERGVLHGDLKLENFLISKDGQAKLSDLGSARLMGANDPTETTITFTSLYAHPDLLALMINRPSDPNRAVVSIQRSQLKPSFDLYALGLNILRVIGIYENDETGKISGYYKKYLELLALRMLDGKSMHFPEKSEWPRSIFQEIKYETGAQVLLDLKKLTGEYDITHAVPELDTHFPRTLQCSKPNSLALTDRLSFLLSSPYLRRLGGISQLGLIVQIYPTATHSRLEHVLGCYANVARYIDALWHDPVNPFFRQVFGEPDLTLALVAGLCHDIGQYAMAHDLEEADKQLFSHTTIGAKILQNQQDADSLSLKAVLREQWNVGVEDLVKLLECKPTDYTKSLKMRFLHSLIDGPLDADKLDYLVRDSQNLNVPYGQCIDIGRLLKCLTLVLRQNGEDTDVTLGIHEKGKFPAEAVAFARYAMFGTVYWHHTSRSAKSMLHRAVWEAIPSWDRRSTAYKDFMRGLHAEIQRQGRIGAVPEQEKLYLAKELQVKTPQLNVSDYEMLRWIHQLTSTCGKALIELLCNRVLYKRLMIISQHHNNELWDQLTKFRKDSTGREMIKFQTALSKRLVEKVSRYCKDTANRTPRIAAYGSRLAEIVSRGEAVFLVDIPGDRPGSTTELSFYKEHRTYGLIETQHVLGDTEESIVWRSLSSQFISSIGKVRVFCHPEISDLCSFSLDRKSIQSALESAMSEGAAD